MTNIHFGDGETFFNVQQDVNQVYEMISDSRISSDSFVAFTDTQDGTTIYIRKDSIVAFCKPDNEEVDVI